MGNIKQPELIASDPVAVEDVILFALGDFQSRKKVLAGRELALDRLGGALRRAVMQLNSVDFSDDAFADGFEKLGAKVVKVPSFVAKHPYRVTVTAEIAERASEFFRQKVADGVEK